MDDAPRRSLRDQYFGDEGFDKKPDPKNMASPPPIQRREGEAIARSRPVDNDQWVECEAPWEAYTPYGKGTVVAENLDKTHFKVEFRDSVFRRVVKKNCLLRMKLSQRQHTYRVDETVISTTGRKYRGVMDELRYLGSDPAVLEDVCSLNGLDYGRYAHLNTGHQRMVIGNMLRARLKKGETVRLGVDWIIDGGTDPVV